MLDELLKSVGSALRLGASGAPLIQVPVLLPKLQAPTAGTLAEKAGLTLSPASSVAPTQSVAQLLNHLLNDNQDMLGGTKAIAHGLSQRDGVKWAVNSCRMVEAKLPPEHRDAVAAADAFANSPNAINRARAAAAAEKAGPQSPAGLAAKAASMADVPDAPAVPGADTLVPTCVVGAVTGAVALSPKAAKLPEKPSIPQAGMPKIELATLAAPRPPGPGSPESARNAIAFKPFIDAGLALAAGKA